MSKRPSLEALAQQNAATSQQDTSQQNDAAFERDNVTMFRRRSVKTPKRILKAAPHMSLYVGKRVQRALKEIALEYDCKSHDVLLEAVDMVLQRYGRPCIAELSDDV